MIRQLKVSLILVASILSLATELRGIEVPLDVEQSSLKFTGHAFLHDFNGEAKRFSGTAELNLEKPTVDAAKIDIQTARLTTFNDARDRNMLAWLNVDLNPEIGFRLTRVALVSGDPAHATNEHPATFMVGGTFVLNRVPKPMKVQVKGWREGNLLVVTGKTKVDTAVHGLPIVNKFFLTVDKDVDINFHIAFHLPRDFQWPSSR